MKIQFVSLFALAFSFFACQSSDKPNGPVVMDSQLKHSIEVLQKSSIYFGHQSVGADILGGIRMLTEPADAPKLNVVEYSKGAEIPDQVFLHSFIGKNTQPKTKCEDFAGTLRAIAPKQVDLAIIKFCYIDFNGNTDVNALFGEYQNLVNGLKVEHPATTFVHVTVPLKADEGLKGVLKKLMGKGDGDLENVKRGQYNAMMLKTFVNEPIFDLAKYESTRPNGNRDEFTYEGATFHRLAKTYTDDGGHLNQVGKPYISKEFLNFLAGVLEAKQSK